MKCRYCQEELPEGSAFCSACGKSQEEPKKRNASAWAIPLAYYLFGLLFILCGILPLLLHGDREESTLAFSKLIAKSDAPQFTAAAVNGLSGFATLLSPLFYFAPSALAVYAGLRLFKKDPKAVFSLAILTAAHLLSVIHSLLTNFFVCTLPDVALSLMGADAKVAETGVELMAERPGVFSFYEETALRHLWCSLAVILLAVLWILLKKRLFDRPLRAEPLPGGGLFLMIPAVSLLGVLSNLLTPLHTHLYGSLVMASASAAGSAFDIYFRDGAALWLLVLLAVAVLLTKPPKWILALAASGATVILGLAAFLSSRELLTEGLSLSEEILAPAYNALFRMLLACVLLSVALFLYAAAASRGTLPRWLSVALPILVPVFYLLSLFLSLLMYARFSGGTAGVAVLVILLSLCKKRSKKVKAPANENT